MYMIYREEAEGVSELTLENPPRDDAHTYRELGIQGQKIRRSIHNFDQAYVLLLDLLTCC